MVGPFNTEPFTYDAADRLTGWKVNSTAYTADYSGNGNPDNYRERKSDFGLYAYSSSKPHAVSGISSLIAGTGAERTCEAEYNTIGKVSKLVLKNGSTTLKTATFTYAADGQRRKMVVGSTTTIYCDDYQVNTTGSTEQRLHYISGPAGLCALIVQNYSNGSLASRATYYLQTDYQGSIIAAYNSNGTLYKRFAYDPWGRRRAGDNWTNYQTSTETLITRGYCGHEHLDDFGTINMNGRIYDPRLGRFLSPDPYVQAPYNSQNYNRYSYCLNNPLKYTDPSGESIIAALIIGAVIGTYVGGSIANESYNPVKWNWESGKTWRYMFWGSVVGGISGALGGAVAASGMPFANTASIGFSSFFNSVGTSLYTDGQTPVSIGLGAASYDFTNNTWGYLGKKGNSKLENVLYGMGALANVADVLAGFKPGDVSLRTENDPNYSKPQAVFDENGNIIGYEDIPCKDLIGHSQIVDKNGKPLVEWGPSEPVSGFDDWVPGTNSFEKGVSLPASKMKWDAVNIKGVNVSRISNWNPSGKYNLALNSCVSQASRALNASGVFNVGIHPYLLHAQMYLRSIGVRPCLFSYMFQY